MKTDQDTQTDRDQKKKITETIEEIIPDDTTSDKKDLDVLVEPENQYACFNCGYRMIAIKACMLRCINCGATKDCSEKAIW